MGGFSFINTDYLVDKLQGILSSTASVAFDLGLEILYEQCSNIIKNFKAISDKVNNDIPQAGDVTRMTNGCNAGIRNTFLSGGSLLENVGSKLSLPADYTNLIRGLVEM